jgi:deoxyadenosine/deoxycytidine kinase
MGLMDTRDFENYTSLFELMQRMVGYPDLLIYLRSSIPNLVAQIQKRGREYENSIRIDYLSGLNDRYEKWIADYKGELLIIDVDTCRFEDRKEDFSQICDQIDARLFGLFQ